MNLKVGDSVLYLHLNHKHTGIITAINPHNPDWPYSVHWINDQDTCEPEDEIQEYRKQYLQILHWGSK